MKINSIGRRKIYFSLALVLQLSALLLMAFDPAPHGFGVRTLWIGAPLLMIGILLPIVGMTRVMPISEWSSWLRKYPYQSGGFMIAFLASFLTYLGTLEPTASLWDCSEMIAAAYKLQVPHTPGTPLTLLLGRLFSMLALGDVSQVAWYINLMSAFFSAGAVGFTFLLTWYFGRTLCTSRGVLFAGSLGGALCLAFSDSFWFSAVEAETYGPSVFCMLLLILLSKESGQLEENTRRSRLQLLSYLTGLSYCVHPMCILVLPVCFLIWRGGAKKVSWKQVAISFSLGIVSILFISKVISVALFEWVFQLDLLLVNSWSFPMYSGLAVFALIVVVASGVVWKKYKASRVVITSIFLVLAGFSPYLMLFVRSAKQPPINEFSPRNLAKIKPYMNRESYPSRPLLFGPYFDAQIARVFPKAKSYIVDQDGQYKEVGELLEYDFENDRRTILPRIYSNEARHIETYRQWTGLLVGEKPRFSDNLKFLWKYQLGHMYGRYMMWNFAGRADDVQHADWLAPWEGVGDRSSINYSKAENQYFMIPLLLGVLGFIIQSRRDKQGFLTHLAFFLITGFLLVMYLNGTPNEPRERDYIYVGSYVAFSFWVGLGMMSLSLISTRKRIVYLSALAAICVPSWIFYQNLDDHNRSNRTFQVDNARNILASCDKGAVLFTGGDNDTFPLWYLQEVEGFRTDVRVMVMSYFNADWYINQLTRQYYDSPPFKLTLKESENQYGPFEPLYVQEVTDATLSWSKYMDALKAESPRLKMQSAAGHYFNYLPSRHLSLATGGSTISFEVEGNYLPKSEIAILDLLYSNGWERPIYFNFTAISSLNINIQPYLSKEGLLQKWTPERSASEEQAINLERSFKNLVEDADYSNLANPEVYFNQEDYESRMIAPIKFAFNEMIHGFLAEGNIEKATESAGFANEKLYFAHLRPSYADLLFASILQDLNKDQESEKLINRAFLYYHELLKTQLVNGASISRNDLIVFQQSARLLTDAGLIRKYEELMEGLSN